MLCSILLAVSLLNMERSQVSISIDADRDAIDPGRSVFLDMKIVSAKGIEAQDIDLRSRVRGFSLAEEFADEPEVAKDGSRSQSIRWRLVPEPCAKEYKIAPFAVEVKGSQSFVAGPIYFKPPVERESVEGAMEIYPKKDLPPLSWKLVGWGILALSAIAAIVAGGNYLVKFIAAKWREHRMSPVERAWVELDRLMKKGLPGRGKFKDFYVELTMVVRRYVRRQHGIKAPHLTTEEFFAATRASDEFPKEALDALMEFLNKADMIKFAGVEATPETADDATQSAKAYIASDDKFVRERQRRNGGV